MITRAFNLKLEGDSSFKDVSSVQGQYVEAVRKAGIMNGYSSNEFGPNDKLTRGQVALILSRAFELEKTDQIAFSDVNKGMDKYDAIQQVAAHGIARGYSDGTYKPGEIVTRGHFSTFLTRGLQNKTK